MKMKMACPYAATMVDYIGFREFEFDLEGLLTSRHPAESNSAKGALEILMASTKAAKETLPAITTPAK